jgi:hypothetical protein
VSISAIEIERVVREVLAELVAAPTHGGQTRPETPAKVEKPMVPPPAVVASVVPGDLVIGSRVVTMDDILGRLDSVRRVLVPRGAVVTPAVRDELLRRGIALECEKSSSAQLAATRLLLITTGTDFDPDALLAALGREGFKLEHTALDCLIASADQLAAEVAKGDALGVLLTRHTAAALCLANRQRGVRAVTGCDAPAVATASAAVGANVLVADPLAGTFFQIKQMVSEFCRGGVRACPSVFQARLG